MEALARLYQTLKEIFLLFLFNQKSLLLCVCVCAGGGVWGCVCGGDYNPQLASLITDCLVSLD